MAQADNRTDRETNPGEGAVLVRTTDVTSSNLPSAPEPPQEHFGQTKNLQGRWQRNPWVAHLLALTGYFLATVLLTWPLSVNLGTAIPGDSFDGWQNYWNLWWVRLALVDKITNPLVTDILYAPTGVSLYFHTLNPFNGLVTLPVQLTFGLIPAYNTVVFLSWILAGYGMFLLARWVVGTANASLFDATADSGLSVLRPNSSALLFFAPFLAGLVYTLSPFHMAHLLGHMQVMSLQWIPFYVVALLQSLQLSVNRKPWLGRALLAGLFLVLTGLCDWYFVLYLFLFTGLALLWGWWRTARRAGTVDSLIVTLRPALVAGALFALVLSPWLVPMVREATRYQFMVRPGADLYILSASVMDFLIPNRLHTLFRPASFEWIGNQVAPVSERTLAIGYVPLVLALTTLFLARRKAAFWWVVATCFFLLALGPQWHLGNFTTDDIPAAALQSQEIEGWTPYAILNRVIPFMRISRSVSRFALMVQLAAAVLAAVGLAAIWARCQVRRARDDAGKLGLHAQRRARPVGSFVVLAVYVALLLLLLGEYWVAPYPMSPPDTPAYYYATWRRSRRTRRIEPTDEFRPARLSALSNRAWQTADSGLYQS